MSAFVWRPSFLMLSLRNFELFTVSLFWKMAIGTFPWPLRCTLARGSPVWGRCTCSLRFPSTSALLSESSPYWCCALCRVWAFYVRFSRRLACHCSRPLALCGAPPDCPKCSRLPRRVRHWTVAVAPALLWLGLQRHLARFSGSFLF